MNSLCETCTRSEISSHSEVTTITCKLLTKISSIAWNSSTYVLCVAFYIVTAKLLGEGYPFQYKSVKMLDLCFSEGTPRHLGKTMQRKVLLVTIGCKGSQRS